MRASCTQYLPRSVLTLRRLCDAKLRLEQSYRVTNSVIESTFVRLRLHDGIPPPHSYTTDDQKSPVHLQYTAVSTHGFNLVTLGHISELDTHNSVRPRAA